MSGPESTAIVEVVSLRKVFDHTTAVADASFSIEPGRSLAIVGESGSGKSTIAKILAGLEIVTSGTVRVCGRDRTRRARGTKERRRRGGELQIVFQDPYSSLDPRQRTGDCIAEVMEAHRGLSRRECKTRSVELAELVGLDSQHLRSYPSGLSGGQRQRVAIARALAAEPKVIVMDEAVASLDVSVQAQVLNTISDVRERTGATIVFISHDLTVVRQVTDDVIVMRSGEIVEVGTTPDVLDFPKHPYTQLLRASVPSGDWKPPVVGQTPKL